MYDPISTQTSSVNCAGLDFFNSAVDFDDLAFLNMVLCMQESDSALAAKMKDMREINEKKTALNNKISYLNIWITRSEAKEPGEKVYVEGGLEDPVNPAKSKFPEGADQREHEKALKDAKTWQETAQRELDEANTNGTAQQQAMCQDDLNAANARVEELSNDVFVRKDVEAKIQELRGKLEDMNSASSIMMIDFQRLMNGRNQASQLVSNIESKSNQTAMGIIANFK